MTNYIYHLYGDDEIFLIEACYSIGTLRKKIDPNNSRIILFTDRPARVDFLPVTLESIADELQEMKGPFGFDYRVKLACILKCAELHSGNIVYLDCDTIIKGPIEKAAAQLTKGRALMYREERLVGRFEKLQGFKTQLPGSVNYACGPASRMFNAGVIGLCRDDAKIMETALALCDALMREGPRYHICEQFAATEALRLAGVKILETDKFIAHYYRTSAKQYMHDQFSRFAPPYKELWNHERPISYSYPRVQWHKLMRKIFK